MACIFMNNTLFAMYGTYYTQSSTSKLLPLICVVEIYCSLEI